MRSVFVFALALALTSCATSKPSSSQWAGIEGCWSERAEHWPAYMAWRRDPAHPGGYLGDWQREAAQMDVEHTHFALTPSGDGMQLCFVTANGPGRCAPAVFGRAGWRRDSVAVFDVDGDYHEFGFAGAAQPFFSGQRRDCN